MKIKIHKCKNKVHPFPVFGWLIMIFQGMAPWKKDSYSHMAMSVDVGEDNILFYDCRFSEGCAVYPASKFLKNYTLIESHELKEGVSYVDFTTWFDKFEGKKYDYLQLLGIFLKSICVLKVSKIGHNLKKLICCELMLAFFADFYGYKYIDSDDYDMKMVWDLSKEY